MTMPCPDALADIVLTRTLRGKAAQRRLPWAFAKEFPDMN